MKRKFTSSYNEYMCAMFHEYVKEQGDDVDLGELYEWAREHDKWDKPKLTLKMIFKREMGRALRSERIVDDDGNQARRNHVIRLRDGDRQQFLWNDILTIRPDRMQMSMQQRRLVLAAAAIQHDHDVQYYNMHNEFGAQLMFDYDLNKHVEDARHSPDYPDERPEDDEDDGAGQPA
jgi:hypothetical protein